MECAQSVSQSIIYGGNAFHLAFASPDTIGSLFITKGIWYGRICLMFLMYPFSINHLHAFVSVKRLSVFWSSLIILTWSIEGFIIFSAAKKLYPLHCHCCHWLKIILFKWVKQKILRVVEWVHKNLKNFTFFSFYKCESLSSFLYTSMYGVEFYSNHSLWFIML